MALAKRSRPAEGWLKPVGGNEIERAGLAAIGLLLLVGTAGVAGASAGT